MQLRTGDRNTKTSAHLERKLACLGNKLSIDHDHRATIIIDPPSIAALLICIQVHSTGLGSGCFHELQTLIQLSQLVVAPASIGDYFNAFKFKG
jgi:hypothetical protein